MRGAGCLQDCGKPYYTSNYLAFHYAIRQAWPQLQLVANCDLGQDAPTQVQQCSQSISS